ncbi:hypothetical protein QQ045_030014 [Rhodiola kirilowii]
MEKNDLSRVKYLPGNDLSNASLEALVDIDTPAAQTETIYDEKIPVVDDSSTEEDRQAFINELQRLWRMVNNLGGYEQVLLDYEMHLRQTVDCKGGEVICRTPANSKKEVNSDLLADENLKTGSNKRKRKNSVELADTVDEFKQYKASDVGLRAEWVKVNVQATMSSFEVYVLIPGLRPEEVHVKAHSDGILIINGQPQELNDGPWGIRPFKKIVRVPGRIDPMQMKVELSTVGTMRISMPYLESDDD